MLVTRKGQAFSSESYADSVARHIAGITDMHGMPCIRLGGHIPVDGPVLVLGTGGGLDLQAFAEMQLLCQFGGVEPPDEMLAQVTATLGEICPLRWSICQAGGKQHCHNEGAFAGSIA